MREAEADYQRVLSERRAWAQRQRDSLVAAIESTRDARSITFSDDEHDPDGSTASLDQARDAALLASIERLLTDLDAARLRLADGTFGRCQVCGDDVPCERLLARPEAATCVYCASRRHP